MIDTHLPATSSINLSGQESLIEEIQIALSATSNEDILAWGNRSGIFLIVATIRRVKNLSRLLKGLYTGSKSELSDAFEAALEKNLSDHLKARGDETVTITKETVIEARKYLVNIHDHFRETPKEIAPKFATAILGFYIGSGGLDGDGGVPDLDFLGGIGEHRSLLTHTPIAGIIIEVLLFSFVDLVRTVYEHLPTDHDTFWDNFINISDDYGRSFSNSVSLGIAYHLGIDATLDGEGTFKNIPFYLPQEGHQFIAALGGLIEGQDALKRIFYEKPKKLIGQLRNIRKRFNS